MCLKRCSDIFLASIVGLVVKFLGDMEWNRGQAHRELCRIEISSWPGHENMRSR